MKKLVLAATVSALAMSSVAFAGGPVVIAPEPVPAPPVVVAPASAINPAWAALALVPLALLLSDSDDDTSATTTTIRR